MLTSFKERIFKSAVVADPFVVAVVDAKAVVVDPSSWLSC
jgi:hypothetical protein